MEKNNTNQKKLHTQEVKNISYKIVFEDNSFKIGFADRSKSSDEIRVLCEFQLNEDQFKGYFTHMLKAVLDYNQQTGKNMIKELFQEKV